MKYAFLTTLVPKQLEEEVASRSRHNMQDAANALQWHIYDGLCVNYQENIKLFNVLPIGNFPQYYSKAFVKKSLFHNVESKNLKKILMEKNINFIQYFILLATEGLILKNR